MKSSSSYGRESSALDQAPQFSADCLRRFDEYVGRLLVTDVGLSAPAARDFVDAATNVLQQHGQAGLGIVAQILDDNPIRSGWNAVLASARPAVLSGWIAPNVSGTMLDLLCGNGRVGEALAGRGIEVALSERLGAYDCDRAAHRSPFVPMDQLAAATLPSHDTVLVCTVLHHEKAPEPLLDVAARLARRRIIVVENCIEDEYEHDYHVLIDLFFNCSLNRTVLPITGSHRRISDWITLLAEYGTVSVVERKEDVPGIPLPHHLIVVETSGAAVSGSGRAPEQTER